MGSFALDVKDHSIRCCRLDFKTAFSFVLALIIALFRIARFEEGGRVLYQLEYGRSLYLVTTRIVSEILF